MNRYTERQRRHWNTITRIARHDYDAAMRLAGNFGRLLAERDMKREAAQRIAEKGVAA